MKILSARAKLKQQAAELSDKFDTITACEADPKYFIDNYIKDETVFGKLPIILTDPQRRFIDALHQQDFTITVQPRQAGQTTAFCAFLTWTAFFRESTTSLYVAPNSQLASSVYNRIRVMIDNVPDWLKPSPTRVYSDSIEFDNGSLIVVKPAKATIKGLTLTNLVLGDFAINDPQVQQDLWHNLIPTIASTGKLALGSTPVRAGDLFHKLWADAEAQKNALHPVRVRWQEIFPPSKYLQIANMLDAVSLKREYDCEFIT